MKSMWARYREELSNTVFVEYEWGFFSYVLYPDVLCVEDAYVVPEERRKGRFREIVEEAKKLAAKAGRKKVVGCVTLVNYGAAESLKCHLACGGEPYLAEDGKIWLRTEV